MKEEIGGFFELELKCGKEYHNDALSFNTGRNCLKWILENTGLKKIYIPLYNCDVIENTLEKLNINHDFYPIDVNLDPVFHLSLSSDEALLIVNYFGIKDKTIFNLADKHPRLIADHSQAFFCHPLSGHHTFYSARKFFGVPDGAYLYSDSCKHHPEENESSWEHCQHLLRRTDDGAHISYAFFKENEARLAERPPLKMSLLSKALLKNIDYNLIKNKRIENYKFLHRHLGSVNELRNINISSEVPMVYPFLHIGAIKIRQALMENKIYTATYWKNVAENTPPDSFEHYLSLNTVALPIDQRYSEEEMKFILTVINKLLK